MARLQQAFRTSTPLHAHAWRLVWPRRTRCAQGAVLAIRSPPSSLWARACACDPWPCAFLCVVCALQSVPDFIKPWALLFKVDRCVSKCISYYRSPWGLFKNQPIKTLFISVLGQTLQLIFLHTCDVAVCPFSA